MRFVFQLAVTTVVLGCLYSCLAMALGLRQKRHGRCACSGASGEGCTCAETGQRDEPPAR